jgi:rsbT antagonist protein RsbS
VSDQAISVLKTRQILLVSMPSDPDDGTIDALQSKILEEMERYEVRWVVLDLAKVDILDSYFARTVAETAQMVTLMGGETIIAGMRPAVAITATQLGLTLGRTRTALNVERALDMAGQSLALQRL